MRAIPGEKKERPLILSGSRIRSERTTSRMDRRSASSRRKTLHGEERGSAAVRGVSAREAGRKGNSTTGRAGGGEFQTRETAEPTRKSTRGVEIKKESFPIIARLDAVGADMSRKRRKRAKDFTIEKPSTKGKRPD